MQKHPRNLFLLPPPSSLLPCNIYAGIGEREGGGEIFGGTVLVFSKMHQGIDKKESCIEIEI